MFILFSCTDSHNEEYINSQKDRSIKYTYFKNGRVEKELPYNMNSLLDGYVKIFRVNGNLESVAEYKDGRKVGVEKDFYPNGKLKIKREYKNGLLHGNILSYWENGNKKEEYSLITIKKELLIF